MSPNLPARPNLDHLRRQAKTRLAEQRAAGATVMRLADAQLAVARETGFANWPALSRHVQQLRALEGRWRFDALEIDGQSLPPAALTASVLLIDGDRFRMESPEGNYEGIFNIDVEATPHHIDIEFIEGPEAGQWSYGLFECDGDALTICLGLVGSSRPERFATAAGSGHALERLTREDRARPDRVTGGTRQAVEPPAPVAASAVAFDAVLSDTARALEGDWVPTALVMDGKPMPDQWLAFGRRTQSDGELKVVFGGQTQVHARVRIDDTVTPMTVDYLHLSGPRAGSTSAGLFEWRDGEASFLMAAAGQPRPASFDTPPAKGLTFSRWRRSA